MRPWAAAIGVLIAVGLLAGPTGAGAEANLEVQERSLRLNLATKGSNGFRGFVSTAGHRRVVLTLVRGEALMNLRTTGRVSRRGIVARFGDLATVSVRFQGASVGADPSARRRGQRNDATPGCSGRDPIVERGVFRGTIRFRGENGFTNINARVAPGTVERRFRRVCKRSLLGELSGLFEELFGGVRLTLLEARARVDDTNVAFEAASFDLGPGAPPSYSFVGRTAERRDGMEIFRGATAEAQRGFLAGKPGAMPQQATTKPPKPFQGSAEYRKDTGLPAGWTGPLAVPMPGVGRVALTGAGFKSALCSLTVEELLDGHRCLRRRSEPEPNSLAALTRASTQGSGSQSQAFWDARLSWSR